MGAGSEIYKQYSEFDDAVKGLKEGILDGPERYTLALADVDEPDPLPSIPFRQSVGFGQIVQWDEEKLVAVLNNMNLRYQRHSISERILRARSWLETYNKDGAVVFLEGINKQYAVRMESERREHICKLYDVLKNKEGESIQELEKLIYDIPKETALSPQANALRQKSFFKDVYNLLIGKDAGPRLSTFLWATDRNKVLQLLRVF